jgi:hypothetical protein
VKMQAPSSDPLRAREGVAPVGRVAPCTREGSPGRSWAADGLSTTPLPIPPSSATRVVFRDGKAAIGTDRSLHSERLLLHGATVLGA